MELLIFRCLENGNCPIIIDKVLTQLKLQLRLVALICVYEGILGPFDYRLEEVEQYLVA